MKNLAVFALAAGCTASCLLPASATQAAVSSVGEALSRPAVMTRQPAATVLLGAAQTGKRLVAVGERGLVLLSDDEGRNWQQVLSPVSVTLTAVRFVGQHGFAVGHGGTVLTSDDAGSSWKLRLDGRRAAELALQAALATGDAAALKAAQQLVKDGPDKPFLDVLVFDEQRALAVGAYGLAFATQDGGKSWAPWMSRLDNPKGLHIYAARARGEHIVMAGEQGLLLQSDNAGRQFNRISTPYKGSFFTLELPADNEIVLAGLRGNVWRSTNAGSNWAQVPVAMPVSITGSALRADGTLLFVNQAGLVLAGRNGEVSPLKSSMKTNVFPPLNAVLARADGSLLLLGVQGAITLPAGAVGVAP